MMIKLSNQQSHPLSPRLFSLSVSASTSPSGDLQLGSKAVLQCQVKGLIPEAKLEWRSPDGRPYVGSDVVLNSVAHLDAGDWKCMFSHDGVTYNDTLRIKVTGRTPASTQSLCFLRQQKHYSHLQRPDVLYFCFQNVLP